MNDMQANSDRSALYYYGRYGITELRSLPKPHCFNEARFQSASDLSTANRAHPLNDTIMKCLDRDDPLRHACLRARWQAS
jgi:hypothetical protein